jgi:hypothetical protein
MPGPNQIGRQREDVHVTLAAKLLDQMVVAVEFPEFLTLAAYELMG